MRIFRGNVFTDALGLDHSLLGLCCGVLGLLTIPFVIRSSASGWALGSAGLLVLFGVDTIWSTVRSKRTSSTVDPDRSHESVPDEVSSYDVRLAADWFKLLWVTAVMLLFTVGSVYLLTHQTGPAYWISMFFGACFLVGTMGCVWFLVFARELYVIVDSVGVTERTRPPRQPTSVSWNELKSASVTNIGRSTSLTLTRAGGGEPVFVVGTFIKGGSEAVWRAIQGHPKYRGGAST